MQWLAGAMTGNTFAVFLVAIVPVFAVTRGELLA